jgi:uncharacterized membrane protein
MAKNGIMCLLGMAFLIVAMFALLVISITQAYSYNNEEDNDNLEYYDYHTGQWEEISEPDPYSYPVSYSCRRSPVSMMMPLFIIFFVVFLPWLAYALDEESRKRGN